MGSYNRRIFLKHSAILAAATAANQIPLPCALARQMTDRRGANHPFFTAARNRPEVIAHQGGKGQWPANTMFAFEQAAGLGVDVLEMDVHSTRDGVLVLMHNDSVDETTDRTGPIRRYSLAELKRLDAGFRWTDDGGRSFRFREKGITVPTLEEVFRAFPRLRMNIEIKQERPSIVAPLCELINRHAMAEKVLVASFSDEALADFRRRCPGVATSASRRELLAFSLGRNVGDGESRPDALQMVERVLIVRLLNRGFVERAHRANFNLPVHAWTVNDIDDMRRVLALGVDGIITDYPGPLLALLERLRGA